MRKKTSIDDNKAVLDAAMNILMTELQIEVDDPSIAVTRDGNKVFFEQSNIKAHILLSYIPSMRWRDAWVLKGTIDELKIIEHKDYPWTLYTTFKILLDRVEKNNFCTKKRMIKILKLCSSAK